MIFIFDYEALKNEITALGPHIDAFSAGKSLMGRELYCIKIGCGKRTVFVNGAHHGLEYITSALLMKFTKEILPRIKNDIPMFGYPAAELAAHTTLYIMPMVNPDGVDIAVNGIDIKNGYHRRLINTAGVHRYRSVWQANAAGVDLNHNYDAAHSTGAPGPAPSLYGGEAPEDQPESAALAALIRRLDPDVLLCFHSQGREIYSHFYGRTGTGSDELLARLAAVSGYAPAKEEGTAAYGGCKDWFIKEYSRPGFTIEAGSGTNPLPVSLTDSIFEENARIILETMLC